MMPPGTTAELIGGVVSMPSPVGPLHADARVASIVWLDHYAEATVGVQVLDNASTALDELGEPQPDAQLRIRPEFGGQTRNEPKFIAGAPELVLEISHTTRSMDLGRKLADYERAGVIEYVVCGLDPDEVIWHIARDGRLVAVPPDADGVFRSGAFPGLWLDPTALLASDRAAVRAAVDRGLATPEHAAFVAHLAATRKRLQGAG
jgi:Uma2 family endonuclease